MTIFWGRGLTSIHTVLLRMLKGECGKEKFKFGHSPPEDFVLCLWQKKPNVLPIWLAFRFILFVYFLITFFIMVFRPKGDIIWYKNFIYMAYWAYFTEVLYFGMAFCVCVEKFVKEMKNPTSPPMEEMPWHYKVLWFLCTTTASTSLTVSTMFWFFIYDPKFNRLPYSLVTRGSNSVLFLLDVFLNAIPFRFLHFYVPCIIITIYIIFTVIYQFSGGTGNRGQILIYTILDWRNPSTAFSTFAIYLSCVLLFHCGMCVINIMKNWLKKPSET